jgi:hypothetical protein
VSYLHDGFEYYRTPRPVAQRDEQFAPVPGWGMDPRLAGPPWLGYGSSGIGGYGLGDEQLALGATFTIGTPLGNQKVDVPIDKMADAVVASAYPDLEKKMLTELVPKMVPAMIKHPAVQSQIAAAQAQAEAAKKQAVIGAVLILGSIWAAAWWIKKSKGR